MSNERILATWALDQLDAAIESLPPECRPSGVDPAGCPHPVAERWQSRGRRTYCGECGTLLPQMRERPDSDEMEQER